MDVSCITLKSEDTGQSQIMIDNPTAPVLAGLAVGIAFVAMFSFFIQNNNEPEYNSIVLRIDESGIQSPPFDKLKVYIFPRNLDSNMDAGDLDWELGVIAGVDFAYGYVYGFGASKLGIYDVNGTIIVPNGTDFYISPDLRKSDGSPVTLEELDDHQRFGDGIMVGDVSLEPKDAGQIQESVPAITFVVAEQDIADVDSKIELIRDSINDPKLVTVTIPEGVSLASSGKTYDPQTIRVVIGYNNTVRWVNGDSTSHFIEANDNTDPDLYRKTTYANPDASRSNLMDPGESFVYTFTNAGEIGYHGMPHLRGTIVVLQQEVFPDGHGNTSRLPEDFSTTYSYGIGLDYTLDTEKDIFTVQTCDDPALQNVTLALSDEELLRIWKASAENDYMNMDEFVELCPSDGNSRCVIMQPESRTVLTISAHGRSNTILSRENYENNHSVEQYPEFARYKNIINTIDEIIAKYKDKIPDSKCVYL